MYKTLTAEQQEQFQTLIALGYRDFQIEKIDPAQWGEFIFLAMTEGDDDDA